MFYIIMAFMIVLLILFAVIVQRRQPTYPSDDYEEHKQLHGSPTSKKLPQDVMVRTSREQIRHTLSEAGFTEPKPFIFVDNITGDTCHLEFDKNDRLQYIKVHSSTPGFILPFDVSMDDSFTSSSPSTVTLSGQSKPLSASLAQLLRVILQEESYKKHILWIDYDMNFHNRAQLAWNPTHRVLTLDVKRHKKSLRSMDHLGHYICNALIQVRNNSTQLNSLSFHDISTLLNHLQTHSDHNRDIPTTLYLNLLHTLEARLNMSSTLEVEEEKTNKINILKEKLLLRVDQADAPPQASLKALFASLLEEHARQIHNNQSSFQTTQKLLEFTSIDKFMTSAHIPDNQRLALLNDALYLAKNNEKITLYNDLFSLIKNTDLTHKDHKKFFLMVLKSPHESLWSEPDMAHVLRALIIELELDPLTLSPSNILLNSIQNSDGDILPEALSFINQTLSAYCLDPDHNHSKINDKFRQHLFLNTPTDLLPDQLLHSMAVDDSYNTLVHHIDRLSFEQRSLVLPSLILKIPLNGLLSLLEKLSPQQVNNIAIQILEKTLTADPWNTTDRLAALVVLNTLYDLPANPTIDQLIDQNVSKHLRDQENFFEHLLEHKPIKSLLEEHLDKYIQRQARQPWRTGSMQTLDSLLQEATSKNHHIYKQAFFDLKQIAEDRNLQGQLTATGDSISGSLSLSEDT